MPNIWHTSVIHQAPQSFSSHHFLHSSSRPAVVAGFLLHPTVQPGPYLPPVSCKACSISSLCARPLVSLHFPSLPPFSKLSLALRTLRMSQVFGEYTRRNAPEESMYGNLCAAETSLSFLLFGCCDSPGNSLAASVTSAFIHATKVHQTLGVSGRGQMAATSHHRSTAS